MLGEGGQGLLTQIQLLDELLIVCLLKANQRLLDILEHSLNQLHVIVLGLTHLLPLQRDLHQTNSTFD